MSTTTTDHDATTPESTTAAAGPGTSSGPHDGGVLLADALSVNALSSGATGLALLVAAPWLDDVLGAHPGVLAAIGAGLVVFAVDIVAALARPATLRRSARLVIAADIAWLVGAIGVVAGDVLTAAGDATLAAVSAAVASFAVAQAIGLRRAGDAARPGVRTVRLHAVRHVAAAPDAVWAAVADAAGYEDVAPGIARTTTDGPVADGMVRRCVDDDGRAWSETCRLVEPGREYRMEVDVDSYPRRYRLLLDHFGMTWRVTRTAGGSRMELVFSGGAKLGVLGRLAMRLLAGGEPHEVIVERYADRLGTGRSVG